MATLPEPSLPETTLRTPRPKRVRTQQSLRESSFEISSDVVHTDTPYSIPSAFEFTDDLTPFSSDQVRQSSPIQAQIDIGDGPEIFTRDVFEDIRIYIQNRHRGSLKTLFRTVVQHPTLFYASAKSLEEVLYEQNPFLSDHRIEMILQQRNWDPIKKVMRIELENFGKTVIGVFEVPSKAQYEDNETNLPLSSISDVERVQQSAPVLFQVLRYITRPLRHKRSSRETPSLKLANVIATLAYLKRPRKFNNLATKTGMFLHHNNITRRGLDVLAALGVCASYTAVNCRIQRLENIHQRDVQNMAKAKNRIVAYDNFNVTDNVRETRVGDEKTMHNITTGLIKIGHHIPPEGLQRSWFRPSYELTTQDVLPLNTEKLKVMRSESDQLWQYYITKALTTQFPQLQEWYQQLSPIRPKGGRKARNLKEYRDLIFTLPVHQRPLKHQATKSTPLGPLYFDESTNEGTEGIHEHLYNEQFKVDDKDPQWEKNIFLTFGDGLTMTRIHTWKADASVSDTPFGQGQWNLPIFGLWHLRYNFIQLLIDTHWGAAADDFSCLYHAWDGMYTNRHFDPKLFQQASDLIIQSFNSRIIALAVQFFQETQGLQAEKFMPDRQEFEKKLQSQNKATINYLVTWIKDKLDIDKNRGLPREQQDDEWTNHLNFLHNVFPYLLLSDSIKYSDIGLLRRAIRDTLLVFSSCTDRWLYRRELCYYLWLTQSPAADRQLQDCILFESLYNRQGKPDSYFEMDRAVEFLNLHLRIVKISRRTSSLTIEKLLSRYARTANYMIELNEIFSHITNVRINNTHRKKRVLEHLWLLAGNLWQIDSKGHSSIRASAGRGSITSTIHLIREGQVGLPETIQKFNQWREVSAFGEKVSNASYHSIREQLLTLRTLVEVCRELQPTFIPDSQPPQSEESQLTTDSLLTQNDTQALTTALLNNDILHDTQHEQSTAEYIIGRPIIETEDDNDNNYTEDYL